MAGHEYQHAGGRGDIFHERVDRNYHRKRQKGHRDEADHVEGRRHRETTRSEFTEDCEELDEDELFDFSD